MKRYVNTAFIYAIAAMVCGVFYREFTKFYGFTGKTTLAFTHLHLFVLGTFLFLLLALFGRVTDVEEQRVFSRFLILYNLALPFMTVMLLVRGIVQVLQTELSKGISAAISGMSGLSHIMMAVSIVMLFLALKKSKAVI